VSRVSYNLHGYCSCRWQQDYDFLLGRHMPIWIRRVVHVYRSVWAGVERKARSVKLLKKRDLESKCRTTQQQTRKGRDDGEAWAEGITKAGKGSQA
jgi:hypothetical protein